MALAEVLPVEATLDDLARVANREHEQAFQAAAAVIEHAIRAGEAIEQAVTSSSALREDLDREDRRV